MSGFADRFSSGMCSSPQAFSVPYVEATPLNFMFPLNKGDALVFPKRKGAARTTVHVRNCFAPHSVLREF